MNGADALIATLADNGVTVCFANPGTSEMPFVGALDREPRMRAVLCLFEGVATGAADGYGRMTGRPACTLLHLGPGYTNGASNLHNARRAGTPLVNIIGDHATYHRQLDPPLSSDILALAAPNSNWVKSAESTDAVGELAAQAVAASLGPPGGCASIILPADSAWSATSCKRPMIELPVRAAPDVAIINVAVSRIRAAKKAVILLGGSACRDAGLKAASRLAALGLRIMTDTFVARQTRGAGSFAPSRMKYFGERALADLSGTDLLVLVETTAPVAFFAYPNQPSVLVPDGCETLLLADRTQNGTAALETLARALLAPDTGPAVNLSLPAAPTGGLTLETIGASIARHMPDQAIVSDDATTSSQAVFDQTAAARPHDWLMLTGGAIGQGIPLALGAAVACPDCKVLALIGDGAAMYTVQALWSIARENLDVTVVVFANHAYRILDIEFKRTGAGNPGPTARSLLDLENPRIDWVSLAAGLGVCAERCENASSFDSALANAMGRRGPTLLEAALTPPRDGLPRACPPARESRKIES